MAIRNVSDQELRNRLKKFNFPIPPITESTRRTLTKKLFELENPTTKSKTDRRSNQGTTRGYSSRSNHLIDYSSAEEEQPPPTGPSTSREHQSLASKNKRLSSRSSRNNSRSSTPLTTTTTNGKLSRAKHLLNYSEGEEEEEEEEVEEEEVVLDIQDCEEEEDDDVEEEEEVDDEEEEVEEEEEVDEDDLDDHFNEDSRINFGGQTSPGLDQSSFNSSPMINGGIHYRGNQRLNNGNGSSNSNNRFASSTPVSQVRPTAQYLSTGKTLNNSNSEGNPSNNNKSSPGGFFNIMSPQLRALANNSREFGSLGEAFNSMPQQSNGSNNNNNSSSVVTQARNNSESTNLNNNKYFWQKKSSKSQNYHKKSTIENLKFWNSTRISKLIISTFFVFLLYVLFKYASLRPNVDISKKLPICNEIPNESFCVQIADRDAVIDMFKEAIEILEKFSLETQCQSSLSSSSTTNRSDLMRFDELEKQLNDKDTLATLVKVLAGHPNWGINLFNSDEEETRYFSGVSFLALSKPPIDWSCWLVTKVSQLWLFMGLVSVYLVYAGMFGLVAYLCYKIQIWRKEKKLQQNQEVFEMVEKVLSLLVAQHQMMSNARRQSPHGLGVNSAINAAPKPWVAINMIRDELIPPPNRKRMNKTWEKVVNYIRHSESRVREDVQLIHGEENRVWQWIPDIHWSPLTHPGPNPFPFAATTISRPTAGTPTTVSNSPMMVTTGISHPGSPHWQGSAFTALNKNVASPTTAPTSCVKVRHLFDSQKTVNPGWVLQVKEEVLSRCSLNAKIVHIAVDTESHEGCVYIKAMSTEDALNVFKTLHGQWYKGNLVTVKYLREERYYERFPDARYQKNPLRPSFACSP